MTTEYRPPELGPVSGLPAGAPPALTVVKEAMTGDLLGHEREWDAVICANDFHGVALAAVAAAKLAKPLVVVGTTPHDGSPPQVLVLGGQLHPGMRFLYVDDFFCLGASWRHVTGWLAARFRGIITATYAAQVRDYQPTDQAAVPLLPAGPGTLALRESRNVLMTDLLPHVRKFEAIVCAWDSHGTALAAVAAAWLGKALVIVCTHAHEDVVSHIVTIGDFDPRMRLLCMCPPDDANRASLLAYLSQSAPANIVATYEAASRGYQDTIPVTGSETWDVAAKIAQLRELYPDPPNWQGVPALEE